MDSKTLEEKRGQVAELESILRFVERSLYHIKKEVAEAGQEPEATQPDFPWLSVPEDKRAYHCPTQALYNAVCQALHEQGHTWASGKPFNSLLELWLAHKEKTCVAQYSAAGYFRLSMDYLGQKGFTIVSAEKALAYWATLTPKLAEPEPAQDAINPSYYKHPSGVECYEIAEHLPFLLGNLLKYVWRWQHKNGLQDLEKALWYAKQWQASPQPKLQLSELVKSNIRQIIKGDSKENEPLHLVCNCLYYDSEFFYKTLVPSLAKVIEAIRLAKP